MAKEYELVGGQPVKVTPLEATEAGTYKAPHGQAFNPVTVTGGSSLPPVTSEDNGDVLTVVDGAWDKAAPSGGGGAPAINFIISNGEIECEYTPSQIEEICASSPTPPIFTLFDGGIVKYATLFSTFDRRNALVDFVSLNYDGGATAEYEDVGVAISAKDDTFQINYNYINLAVDLS